MAVPGVQVELIQGGVDARSVDRGDWSQNVWRPGSSLGLSTRAGFGQITQLDTTLNNYSIAMNFLGGGYDVGFRKHLGSSTVQTEFGTTQIVSVFKPHASTGEGPQSGTPTNKWGMYYSLSIYDVDTGAHYEEVLHHHTSENAGSPSDAGYMLNWHGCYETNEQFDSQNFRSGLDDTFCFHEFQNNLFFSNKYTGLMVYFPVDIRKPRSAQVESAQKNDWVKGYSESSLITPVVAVEGLAPTKFNYLNNTEIPVVNAMCSIAGSMALASDYEIHFSEPFIPNAFVDSVFVQIPSTNKITAIASVSDNLMVFTGSETFLYQPSHGADLSLGQFFTISKTVGCLGPSALFSDGSNCYWVDQNGIYVAQNGTDMQDISGAIEPFFKGGVTSPVNYYLTASGLADPVADEQPRTLYKYSKDDRVTLTYWQEEAALIASFSGNDAAWVFSDGEWSIWPFESAVPPAGAAGVGVRKNIKNPYAVAARNRLFLVGSLDEQLFTDAITLNNFTGTSYYLLEYGIGGSLDRSIIDEDDRSVIGFYKRVSGGAASDARFYIGKPTYNDRTQQYEIPIDLMVNSATSNPTNAVLQFNWSDNYFGFPGGVVPTERLSNAAGYAVTKTVNPGKDTISITLGAAAPVTTNMANTQLNPFYVLLGAPVFAANRNTWGYGIDTVTATVTPSGGGAAVPAAVYVWQQHYGDLTHTNGGTEPEGDKAQPVDWAYKGQQVEDDGNQLQARGLFAVLTSRGSAQTKIAPAFLFGVYNSLLGSDWKDWSSQVVDFVGGNLETVRDKLTVRSRFQDSASAMHPRTFNAAPKYGEYLIDDEEVDTIATSDSTRGKRISYMVFGFIRNKAEKVTFRSLKMLIRPRKGGPRRIGQ